MLLLQDKSKSKITLMIRQKLKQNRVINEQDKKAISDKYFAYISFVCY